MRYAMIMAGGSGTRLWPMSRQSLPKQLIPFIGGRSLLQIALERLEGLVPAERRLICAGRGHRDAVLASLPGFPADRFLGEPIGRDTVNAVGFAAAVLARRDPDAVIAVFTADHVIEPVDRFREIVASGFDLAEARPEALVTFGIAPTGPATGYGYLELGEALSGSASPIVRKDDEDARAGAVFGRASGPALPAAPVESEVGPDRRAGRSLDPRHHADPERRPLSGDARRVRVFREKPAADVAKGYFEAGPGAYLWNSGMFVWRAATLLDCLRRYQPETHAGLLRIAEAWDGPDRDRVLDEVYPALRKVSVDYAVMEPASRDPAVTVAAIPMPLGWLDVGSWPFFAQTCPKDADGNSIAAERAVLVDTKGTLVASSDPAHLVTTLGCENLIVIHTPDATLVCPADRAEAIKDLHRRVGERFGPALL